MSFIIEFLVALAVKRLNRLSIKNWQLLFFQIPLILCGAVFVFCKLKMYEYILFKVLIYFVISLLITDDYRRKKVFFIFFSFMFLSLAIYGLSVFLIEFCRGAIIELFGIKLEKCFNLTIFCGVLLFIFAVFEATSYLNNQRSLKNFLSKVSFLINGKHIEITGLLDSGNSLYDKKNGCAVIVVSSKVLKKILDKFDYERFLDGQTNLIGINHNISYISVGGTMSEMPVISNVNVKVSHMGGTEIHRCSIGFINQKFGDGDYECLVHKDFV